MVIELTDEWKSALNNAYDDRAPVVWASVDSEGQATLAFFGTTQAFSDTQLGLWMRVPSRGFLQRIETNPKVALMYRNPETRMAFQIHGEARRVDDEAIAQQIYDNSRQAERDQDPERQGVAVLVDVVRVIQRGEVVQSRD